MVHADVGRTLLKLVGQAPIRVVELNDARPERSPMPASAVLEQEQVSHASAPSTTVGPKGLSPDPAPRPSDSLRLPPTPSALSPQPSRPTLTLTSRGGAVAVQRRY